MVSDTSQRVRNFPDCMVRRGPGGLYWRMAINFCMARTGQVEVPVCPIRSVADFPNLFVLDRFRWSVMDSGQTVISLTDKCTWGSKREAVGAVYSLAHKNP